MHLVTYYINQLQQQKKPLTDEVINIYYSFYDGTYQQLGYMRDKPNGQFLKLIYWTQGKYDCSDFCPEGRSQ